MSPEEIERFRAGDPVLFRECVERESPRLLAYAFRLTGDGDAAADLVQESWVTAFRKREALTGTGTLSGWLIAICRSLHLSARRSEGKRAERERSGWSAGTGPEVVRVLEESERKRRIAAALGDLPPQQRDVLTLRLLEDRSTRETAERMGIAEGTVKATLHHAIQRMRALLEEQEDE